MASAAASCMECAHHVSHPGHLAASADHPDECLVCQFLHLVYTAAATMVLVPLVVLSRSRRFYLNSSRAQMKPWAFFTRGPPSVW
ncbi:MAG: hypothetical protein K5896_02100 [Prevotella sp.]|nr:hypothetical protein [Prevotella sp.]